MVLLLGKRAVASRPFYPQGATAGTGWMMIIPAHQFSAPQKSPEVYE